MQVTAFKDTVTGLLFPDEAALKQFQSNRAKEEARAKKQRQVAAQNGFARGLLKRKLSCREDFSQLAAEMYKHAIAQYKPRRNGRKLELLYVEVKEWELSAEGAPEREDGGLNLRVRVDVALSRSPGRALTDPFARLSPCEVLHPFTLWGAGGASDQKDGSYCYGYTLTAALKDLPLLFKALKDYAASEKLGEAHLAAVAAKADALKASDAKLAALKDSSQAAFVEMQKASAAYNAATRAEGSREAELQREAERALPYENADAAQALQAQTGLPAAGTSEYNNYRALSIRERLRKAGTPAEISGSSDTDD